MTSNGILAKSSNHSIYLDPKKTSSTDINFVSHAHIDHLPTCNGGSILSSNETKHIANLRGYEISNHSDYHDEFTLIDAGHVLGSRGLLFDDIFYTGDITTRDRGFLKGAKIPKCETLITECTFGLPEFSFPSISEIERTVNGIISEMYSKGIPVILMGYQFGKAQTISQLFGHWDPLYYHDSVKELNQLHIENGIPLRDALSHSEAEKKGLLEKTPWVMISPMFSAKHNFVKTMKEKYGAVTIGFSGWAKSRRFSFGRRCDYSIPLSDHCDFDELVEMVKQSGANHVYTIHGFVDEFASHLNKLGISASPLKSESLENFI